MTMSLMHSSSSPALPPPNPATPRALIADDQPDVLIALRLLLRTAGYETEAVTSPAEVLEAIKHSNFDLVLMDLQLPDISGLDAVAELKRDERTRAIPVVAVTAFALVGDERKALAGGCDGYVSKPIGLRNFLDLVERFIGTA